MTIVAQARPVFRPVMRAVISITNAFPCVITTSIDGTTPGAHGYINGIIIRIDIPPKFGMFQIDKKFASLTVLSPTTFSLPIDTTNFDVFVIPMDYPYDRQYAQCVPIGEDNDILTAAVQNVLPNS